VSSLGQKFFNRRVFAYIDFGIAVRPCHPKPLHADLIMQDGLKLDTKGNVYAGCSDGVQVFNPAGDLLGKFFLGKTAANLVFAGEGNLVILAETEIYLAKLAEDGILPVPL
jgi:gluconolactonase